MRMVLTQFRLRRLPSRRLWRRKQIAQIICCAKKDPWTLPGDGNEPAGFTNAINKLVSERDLTMLMGTHQMGFARDISDRFCFSFDGKTEKQGTPDHPFGDTRRECTRDFRRAVKPAY